MGGSLLNPSRRKGLPEFEVCLLTANEGNLKQQTALGESCIKRFSDGGSTPPVSTSGKLPPPMIGGIQCYAKLPTAMVVFGFKATLTPIEKP